jgi:hypothetical protein
MASLDILLLDRYTATLKRASERKMLNINSYLGSFHKKMMMAKR